MKGAITEDGVSLVKLFDEEGVVVAHVDKTLIVGEIGSVKAAIDTMKGQRDSLTKSESAFGKFVGSQVSKSFFSVSGDISKLPLPELPATEGLSHAGLRFDGSGIKVTMHGKNESLEMLSAMAKAGLVAATNMAKLNMEKTSDDLAEGTAGILGYYMAKNFTGMLEPKIDGDVMSLDFPFEGGPSTPMIFVAVTGILAAVAIPAFMKYIKKSKTAEASMFLKKAFDGARMLGMEGQPLPASVGPTPPLGTCCSQGEKCLPDPAAWQHPTWQALQFSIMDPHYFSYEFVNLGGTYQFKAYADLDCDGMYSTFTIESDLKDGSPDILKEDPLE
jgi:type IV pilus assembly protein PilA